MLQSGRRYAEIDRLPGAGCDAAWRRNSSAGGGGNARSRARGRGSLEVSQGKIAGTGIAAGSCSSITSRTTGCRRQYPRDSWNNQGDDSQAAGRETDLSMQPLRFYRQVAALALPRLQELEYGKTDTGCGGRVMSRTRADGPRII